MCSKVINTKEEKPGKRSEVWRLLCEMEGSGRTHLKVFSKRTCTGQRDSHHKGLGMGSLWRSVPPTNGPPPCPSVPFCLILAFW